MRKKKTAVEPELKTRDEWMSRLELASAEDWPLASIRALEILGRARGWDMPPARATRKPKVPDDYLGQLRYRLDDVRLRMVEASGIAFNQLRASERELMADIREEEARRAREELAARDGDSRIAAFIDELRSLPRSMKVRIREVVLQEVPDE